VLVGSRSLNKRICRFVESLRDSGFEPVLVAVPRRPWGTSGIEDPALVAEQGFITLRSSAPRSRHLRRPELIVSMHWSTLPLAVLLGLPLRTRVIYDEHDHYELLALEAGGPVWANRCRSWLVRRVHRWCLPRVDVVTCIRLAGGQLQAHLQPQASTVIELHNYPSRKWGVRGQHLARPDGMISIVYVGGIWDVKGCRVMLDAFLLLADDPALPSLALHVFGRGDPEIERHLGASSGVTFHGASPYDDIVSFLSGHHCLGLVLLEGTPRYSMVSTNCHKLYEYMATGTAVLATNAGEMPDIVATLDAGWIIDAEFDAARLAEVLREIVIEPRELRRRGDAAAAAVEDNALWWEGEWSKVERSGVLAAKGPRAERAG